jgi:hypothetical protein
MQNLANIGNNRKYMVKRLAALIGALALVSTSAYATFVWDFDFTSPTDLSAGSATAAVTGGGGMEAGWGNDASLGSIGSAGYWDLGISGLITVTIPSLPPGVRLDTITVAQFVDPGFYSGVLVAKVGGTELTLTSMTPLGAPLGGPGGSWQAYLWNVPLGTVGGITITSPETGAIVGQMTVTAVPEASTCLAGALSLGLLGFGWYRQGRKSVA